MVFSDPEHGILWFKSKARKTEMVKKKENCLMPSQVILMFETDNIWFFYENYYLVLVYIFSQYSIFKDWEPLMSFGVFI